MLLNIGQITGYRYLCVSEHWTDHRTDHRSDYRTDCWIRQINLTVSQWSGQIGFIIVPMCVWLRAYQLTVIIIFVNFLFFPVAT